MAAFCVFMLCLLLSLIFIVSFDFRADEFSYLLAGDFIVCEAVS